jgi:hypothetical protein
MDVGLFIIKIGKGLIMDFYRKMVIVTGSGKGIEKNDL